jgi:hypothetical protein
MTSSPLALAVPSVLSLDMPIIEPDNSRWAQIPGTFVPRDTGVRDDTVPLSEQPAVSMPYPNEPWRSDGADQGVLDLYISQQALTVAHQAITQGTNIWTSPVPSSQSTNRHMAMLMPKILQMRATRDHET